MATNQLGPVRKTQITRKPYFVGFSTVDKLTPPYSLTNIDLVKRDISNQFATTLGSRVMLPTFGTRIYEMLFDPFDEYTKNAIIEDAVRVVKSEPRVELVKIDVTQQEHTLTVSMILLFHPEAITSSMYVTFSLKDREVF